MTIACLRIGVVLIKYEDLHQAFLEPYKDDVWTVRLISVHGTFFAGTGSYEKCKEILHKAEYVVPFPQPCSELWCGAFDEDEPYVEDVE